MSLHFIANPFLFSSPRKCLILFVVWNSIYVSGKWFNYGIIFCVMMCDLNMWKNQIFYHPSQYGQYTGIDDKIRTVSDKKVLLSGNASLWSWDARNHIDFRNGKPYLLRKYEWPKNDFSWDQNKISVFYCTYFFLQKIWLWTQGTWATRYQPNGQPLFLQS